MAAKEPHTTVVSGGDGTRAQPSDLLAIGDMVAGYRIEAVAGAGGMGVVYRASEAGLERSVALKVIRPELARAPGFGELFIRESQTAAALEHAHVIPVYRAGEDGGHLYIAMRYVDGESLDALIASHGRLPPARAARLIAQMAEALDAAHERGLVHRDVKPANAMIADPEGEEHVYLTDFGLSVPVADANGARPGRWAGTPGYLAPEQIRGRPVDRRTDVYALGCVLYRALTGRAPFPAESEADVLAAHLTAPPPAVTDVAPELPTGFDEVVRTALAKRPEDRFETAGNLARAALAVRFDVYVCHAPADLASAEALASELRGEGLEPWLSSQEALIDGDPSKRAAEELDACDGCAVLVGAGGLGRWARDEVALAQRIASGDRSFHLFTVLLPGAPEPFDPSLAVLAARPWVDLRAGLDDVEGRRDLIRAVRGELRFGAPMPSMDEDRSPYLGLAPFGEEDAELFFGREEETAEAIERLRNARLLAVLGPSGSGKSSLLRAGVLPALRRGALPGSDGSVIRAFTPGPRPLDALAAQLQDVGEATVMRDAFLGSEQALDHETERRLAGRPETDRIVLLVDQLEEVLTLCRDPAERAAFLGNLRYAATIPGGRVVVLMSLRADFYQRCAENPDLRTLIATQQLLLGPLDTDGLRRAIEQPARLAGLELEPGLERRILGDVGDRPGALPLLEYLLLELWHRRRGRTLTLEAYAASGGVEGALAKRANAVYGSLDPDRQRIARRILLRLTQPGEGTEDTRRRATMEELVAGSAERAEVEAVVGALAEARLLSTGSDPVSGAPIVEITHEALIRGWPELRRWINAARERLRLERRLTDAAREWDEGGREEGLLYRGARLGAWQDREPAGLSALESEFLAASRARAERERAAARRRTRLVLGGLAVALAAISAVAALAIVRGNQAANQRDLARSRQIAASADSQLSVDPELGVLLGEQAYQISPTRQAEEVLRQATFDSRVRAALHGPVAVNDAEIGPDGRLVAVARDDGSVLLWDPRTGGTRRLGHFSGPAYAVAVSPDGRYLAATGAGATVRVWRVASGRELARAVAPTVEASGAGGGFLADVAFSPDGTRIVAGGAAGAGELKLVSRNGRRLLEGPPFQQGEAFVWRWRVPGAPLDLLTDKSVLSVAFDPNGRRVALGELDGKVRLWAGTNGAQPVVLPGRPGAAVQSVAFDDGGRTLFSADAEGRVGAWTLTGRPRPLVLPRQPRAFSVAAAPDGRHLVGAGAGGVVTVWDSRGLDPPVLLLGHADAVVSASFGLRGRDVVTAGNDGTVRLWDTRGGRPIVLSAPGEPAIVAVAVTADGRYIVSESTEGIVTRWSLDAGSRVVHPTLGNPISTASFAVGGSTAASGAASGDAIGTVTVRGPAGEISVLANDGAPINAVALNPQGTLVASAGNDGTVRILDSAAGSARATLRGDGGPLEAVAFSPDSAAVAAGDTRGHLLLWKIAQPKSLPRVLAGHRGAVDAVAFGPRRTLLASAGEDGTVRVWDLASGTPRARALVGHRGPVRALAFNRDGSRLVSGGDDGDVRVWDWERGVQVLVLQGHRGGVDSVAFSADGNRVVSGGEDGTIRVWPCDVCGPIREVLALAGTRVTRPLTAAERRVFLQQGSG